MLVLDLNDTTQSLDVYCFKGEQQKTSSVTYTKLWTKHKPDKLWLPKQSVCIDPNEDYVRYKDGEHLKPSEIEGLQRLISNLRGYHYLYSQRLFMTVSNECLKYLKEYQKSGINQ